MPHSFFCPATVNKAYSMDTQEKPKKRPIILEFIDSTGVTILVLFIFSILLSFPERHWFHAGFGLGIMYFWVYIVHKSIHMVPTHGIFKYMNTHYLLHHQPQKLIDRRIELCIETITDLAMSFSLMFLQWLTGVWVVPISVIIFYAFTYTSVHIFNYSIIGSETHRNHHKDTNTNYGPDTLDHIFGTNYDDTFEDLMPISINAIGAFIAVYALKQHFNWKY